MAKTKLLINLPPTTFTHPTVRPHLRTLRTFCTLRTRSHNTPEEIAPDLAWADAVLMWSWPTITTAMLDEAGGLAYLGQINACRETAEACLARGVPLSEARHCWSPAVAEMALTLTLAGLRRTSDYHAAMRTGDEAWVGEFPADIDPRERELTGAAVGIVGFGGIGQRLAQLLEPFRVNLRVYDPHLPAKVFAQYRAKKTTVREAIRNSLVTVLCAANTAESRHLVGKADIAAFRPGSVLVNVGRASLVDMQALADRLRRNDMVAMLDVFETEPLPKNSPLRKLPNAYLTPHRAGGLLASLDRAFAMLTADLRAALAGKTRAYAVTRKMLPCFA